MNLPATNIPIPREIYRTRRGFKNDSHPKYFFAVFQDRDSHTQKQRREQYSKTITDGTDTDADPTQTNPLNRDLVQNDGNSLYVISFEVCPLQRRRWGFYACAKFLEINYSSVIHNMHYIKSELRVLRFGVENTNTQSFVSCISNYMRISGDCLFRLALRK
jgi:hypothetical protein